MLLAESRTVRSSTRRRVILQVGACRGLAVPFGRRLRLVGKSERGIAIRRDGQEEPSSISRTTRSSFCRRRDDRLDDRRHIAAGVEKQAWRRDRRDVIVRAHSADAVLRGHDNRRKPLVER